MKRKTLLRTLFLLFTVPHFANRGKVLKILGVIRGYRKGAQRIAKLHWKYFFESKGKLNKNLKPNSIESNLSNRYKQTCSYQVIATIKSFLSNVQNKVFDVKPKMTWLRALTIGCLWQPLKRGRGF